MIQFTIDKEISEKSQYLFESLFELKKEKYSKKTIQGIMK